MTTNRIVRMFLLSVVVMMSGAQKASAQQEAKILGKLDSTQNSVTAVMVATGCPLGWTAKVFDDSNILAANARKLAVGTVVIARGDTCNSKPSTEETNRSLAILREDMTPKEDPRLAEANGKVAELTAQVAVLSGTVKELSKKLSEQTPPPPKPVIAAPVLANKSKLSWLIPGAASVVGMTIGVVLAFVFVSRRNTDRFSIPKRMLVKANNGSSHTFLMTKVVMENAEAVAKFGCPYCPEHNLKESNLISHLNRVHPEKVVVEVPQRYNYDSSKIYTPMSAMAGVEKTEKAEPKKVDFLDQFPSEADLMRRSA